MLFLKTKSYIPQAPNNLVNRTKLVNKLDQGLDKDLTIVTAPIGFGKTSLVSEWVSSLKNDYSIAWLNIDYAPNWKRLQHLKQSRLCFQVSAFAYIFPRGCW